MVEFRELRADGTVVSVREIPHAAIRACPHVILVAEHYRPDNTCVCDDQDATVMSEWGYVWDGQRWT